MECRDGAARAQSTASSHHAGRLAHRALHAAARGHVHVSLALQRNAADRVRECTARSSSASRVRSRFRRTHVVVQRCGPSVKLTTSGPPRTIEREARSRTRSTFRPEADAPAPDQHPDREFHRRSRWSRTERSCTWRDVAKDGAELPPHQRRERPATLSTASGRDQRHRDRAGEGGKHDPAIRGDAGRHDDDAARGDPGSLSSSSRRLPNVARDATPSRRSSTPDSRIRPSEKSTRRLRTDSPSRARGRPDRSTPSFGSSCMRVVPAW